MRRIWRVLVTDTHIEQDSVLVEAETEEEAAEIGDDLIESGTLYPVEDYREIRVELYEDAQSEEADE